MVTTSSAYARSQPAAVDRAAPHPIEIVRSQVPRTNSRSLLSWVLCRRPHSAPNGVRPAYDARVQRSSERIEPLHETGYHVAVAEPFPCGPPQLQHLPLVVDFGELAHSDVNPRLRRVPPMGAPAAMFME